MTTLHEISDNHKELTLMVSEGELSINDISDTMDMIEGEFNDKAVSLVAVKDNMQADVTAIDNEIKRLTERKKAIKNKQDSMIEYLRFNMEATGITKIDCPLFSITLAKGRDIVSVDNQSLISPEYMDVKVTSTPMKKEILSAMKNGEEVLGCSIAKSKSSVRIK